MRNLMMAAALAAVATGGWLVLRPASRPAEDLYRHALPEEPAVRVAPPPTEESFRLMRTPDGALGPGGPLRSAEPDPATFAVINAADKRRIALADLDRFFARKPVKRMIADSRKTPALRAAWDAFARHRDPSRLAAELSAGPFYEVMLRHRGEPEFQQALKEFADSDGVQTFLRELPALQDAPRVTGTPKLLTTPESVDRVQGLPPQKAAPLPVEDGAPVER